MRRRLSADRAARARGLSGTSWGAESCEGVRARMGPMLLTRRGGVRVAGVGGMAGLVGLRERLVVRGGRGVVGGVVVVVVGAEGGIVVVVVLVETGGMVMVVAVASGRMVNTDEGLGGRGRGAWGVASRVGDGERVTDLRPRPKSWMGLGIRESWAERGVGLSVAVGDWLGSCSGDRGAVGVGGAWSALG